MAIALARLPRRHLPRRLTVLLPVLGLVLLAMCGLLLVGVATVQVGVLAVFVGVVAALVPVGVVAAALLWLDRWEPEPAKLLLLAFAWGASIAAATALVVNNTAVVVGDLLLGKGGGGNFGVIVSAPVVEEAAKGVFLLVLLWRRSQEFDGAVDAVVYAGFVATGFAFSENIFYFGSAFAHDGFGTAASSGVVAAFVLRGVLGPFTHPLFATFTGLGIGYAARTRSHSLRILAPLGGYLVAVILHSLWNAAARFGDTNTFLNIYFLVMVPIFIAVVMLVSWQRRREQRTVLAELPVLAAARWIAPSEVKLLGSLEGRRRWRRQVRARSGRPAARAVAAYQATVTELAFLRRNAAAGTAGPDPQARQQELLATLKASRAAAVRLAADPSG